MKYITILTGTMGMLTSTMMLGFTWNLPTFSKIRGPEWNITPQDKSALVEARRARMRLAHLSRADIDTMDAHQFEEWSTEIAQHIQTLKQQSLASTYRQQITKKVAESNKSEFFTEYVRALCAQTQQPDEPTTEQVTTQTSS